MSVNTCLDSGTTTPPCSGNGICVNASATLSACLCDTSLWTGGNDVFDMRIATLPGTDERLSLDCTQSAVGTIVVWSFFLLAVLRRAVYDLQAIREQWRRRRPKTKASLIKAMRFRAPLGDLLTTIPLCVIAALLKIVTARSSQTLTIGTDASVTVCYIFGIWAGLGWVLDYSHVQFVTLVRSQIEMKKNRKPLYRISTIVSLSAFTSYFVINIIPTLAALGLDKSIGPVANGEYVILIVRNIGVVLWQLFQLLGSWYLSAQIRKLRRFIKGEVPRGSFTITTTTTTTQGQGVVASPSPEGEVTAATFDTNRLPKPQGVPASSEDSKMRAILDMMDERRRDLLRSNTVAVIFFTTFSIPYAFPYQTYCFAFVSALGIVANSPGKSLHSVYKASKEFERRDKLEELGNQGDKAKRATSPRDETDPGRAASPKVASNNSKSGDKSKDANSVTQKPGSRTTASTADAVAVVPFNLQASSYNEEDHVKGEGVV